MDTIKTYSIDKLDEVGKMTGLKDYPSIIGFLARYYLETFPEKEAKEG